jgi:hypothetical protein
MAAAALLAAEDLLDAVPEVDQMLVMCGFTDVLERARLVEYERFPSLDAFGDYTDTMIESMAGRNEKRTPAASRVRFGIQRTLNIQAVSYWVRKQRREGIPVSIDDLNPDVIVAMTREMNLNLDRDKDKDDKLFQPGKFEPRKYITWARSFENYLDSLRGKSGLPLSYVIRPEDVDPDEAEDNYQRALWTAHHHGPAYREDNRQVYRIYKDLMIGTDGWTWFNRAPNGDGRAAHLLIDKHYRGDAETALRAAEAEATLQKLHYWNEAVFSFEKYVTRMSECFELLEDNDQGLSDAQKVKKMLAGIVSTNQEIVSLKTVVRTNHPNDFDSASTLMATQIALLYPSAENEHRTNKRKISAVAQNQGPNAQNQARGNGRNRNQAGGNRGGGYGRGGGGGNARNRNPALLINGVDVSDPMRNFTSDEWKRLRESGFLSWLIDRRSAVANRRAGNPHGGRGNVRGGRGGGRGEGNGRQVQIGAVTTIPDHDNSTLTDSNQGGTQSTTTGGTAGARFGSLRYRQAGAGGAHGST